MGMKYGDTLFIKPSKNGWIIVRNTVDGVEDTYSFASAKLSYTYNKHSVVNWIRAFIEEAETEKKETELEEGFYEK